MALSRINQPSSNPYSVGAIQLDTTPFANLYIQQRQREQAKDEALDKYFMDYDKSINPAGMRNVEAQDLIRLTNENKDFYFKNKANIKNPALDNGKSYNEWMSRNKTALGLVNQSKQNAQKEQLYNKAILDAKKSGNPIPDSTIEKLARFNKSVYDKDYRDIEANDLDFTPKPFDPIKFKRDNYSDIKLSESAPEITVDDKNNQLTIKTVSKLDKANVPVLEQRAVQAYNSSPSVKYQVDKIIQDPIQLMSLNKVYQKYKGKDVNIQHPEEVAAALLLSLGDTEKVDYVSKNDPKAMAYLSNQLISSRIAQNKSNKPAEGIDFLKKGLEILQAKDSGMSNEHFSAWKANTEKDSRGNDIGFRNIKVHKVGDIITDSPNKNPIKSDIVEIEYTTKRTGDGFTKAVPHKEYIDLKDPELLPKLASYNKMFLGSDAKVEKGIQTEVMGKGKTVSSPKPSQTKSKVVVGKKDENL